MAANSPKYWFKVTATSNTYTPLVFEGGLYSTCVKSALKAVESRSNLWQMRHMNTLHLYEMEDGGVLPDKPLIFINYALERSIGYSSNYSGNSVRNTVKEQPTVRDKYNASSWCVKLELPTSFPVVRHKEEKEA